MTARSGFSEGGNARRRPEPLSAAVTAQMKRMPRRDTGPEVGLRRELHKRGLRFRVHVRSLPGRPDIVFTRARLAVFVDGCFWHGCSEHGTLPKNNREWWRRSSPAPRSATNARTNCCGRRVAAPSPVGTRSRRCGG